MMNRAHASSVRWFDQPMNYREPASDAREATEVPQPVPAYAMSAAASRQELAGAYAEYGRYIFRVLRRLGVPDAALDDAVQDVFVVAWRRHEAFEQRSSTRTWLYGIARRVARDHRRARQRTARHDPEVDTISGGSSPEADTESARAARRVDAVLAQMSDVLREVFVLAEIEQLPVTEIAEIVQAPLNTTYSRLRLARAKFSELVHAERGTR
jgi:RNA polymerase sigma-70 factor (ECF subfamily)